MTDATQQQFQAEVMDELRKREEMITVCPYCGNYTHAETINCCGEASHGVRMSMGDYEDGKEL